MKKEREIIFFQNKQLTGKRVRARAGLPEESPRPVILGPYLKSKSVQLGTINLKARLVRYSDSPFSCIHKLSGWGVLSKLNPTKKEITNQNKKKLLLDENILSNKNMGEKIIIFPEDKFL